MTNLDRSLLDRFAAGDGTPVAFDSNPFARVLNGALVALDRAEGRIVLDFTPGNMFVQGNGVIQGGIVSGMLDFSLGLCVFTRLGPGLSFATVSLTTLFLRPALPGRVRAIAVLDRLGKTAAFSHGALEDGDGRLIATGVSVLSITPAPVASAP